MRHSENRPTQSSRVPDSDLIRPVWNVPQSSFAAGIPKKALTNWLDRGVLESEMPGTGRSRRFSALDVIELAFLARLTTYGCNVERSGAAKVAKWLRNEVAASGIHVNTAHTWRVLSPAWFFVYCPEVKGYAGWRPEDVELGDDPQRSFLSRRIGGMQPICHLADSVQDAWGFARAHEWDVALLVDGLSVIQEVYSSLPHASAASRGAVLVENPVTVTEDPKK